MLGSRIGLTLSVVGCLQGLVTNEIVPVEGMFNCLSCDGQIFGGGTGAGATAVPHHDISYYGMLLDRRQESVEASTNQQFASGSQAANGYFNRLRWLASIADIAIKLRAYENAVTLPTVFKSQKLQGGPGSEAVYPVAEYFRRYKEAERLFFENCLTPLTLQQNRKKIESGFKLQDQCTYKNSWSLPRFNTVATQERYMARNPVELAPEDKAKIAKLESELEWLEEHSSGIEFKEYITLFGSDPRAVSNCPLWLADCQAQAYESKCAARCCPASRSNKEASGISEVITDSDPAPLCQARPSSSSVSPRQRLGCSRSPRCESDGAPNSPSLRTGRFRAPSSRETLSTVTSISAPSAPSVISTAPSPIDKFNPFRRFVKQSQPEADLSYDEY